VFDSGRDRKFSLCTTSRPALGPTQPLIQCTSGVHIPRVKRLGLEADHSFPYNAEVKNGGAMPPLRNTLSWCSA
jgi:hypothetical protein